MLLCIVFLLLRLRYCVRRVGAHVALASPSFGFFLGGAPYILPSEGNRVPTNIRELPCTGSSRCVAQMRAICRYKYKYTYDSPQAKLICGSLSQPTAAFPRGCSGRVCTSLVCPERHRASARSARMRPVRGLDVAMSAKSCPVSNLQAFRDPFSPHEVFFGVIYSDACTAHASPWSVGRPAVAAVAETWCGRPGALDLRQGLHPRPNHAIQIPLRTILRMDRGRPEKYFFDT